MGDGAMDPGHEYLQGFVTRLYALETRSDAISP